jgi:hypothetical protein
MANAAAQSSTAGISPRSHNDADRERRSQRTFIHLNVAFATELAPDTIDGPGRTIKTRFRTKLRAVPRRV